MCSPKYKQQKIDAYKKIDDYGNHAKYALYSEIIASQPVKVAKRPQVKAEKDVRCRRRSENIRQRIG